MRKSSNDVDFVYDGETLAGVCLGYDYCAEHEWGTAKMNALLGVYSGDAKTEKKVFGYDRHRVTNPEYIRSFDMKVSYTSEGKKKRASVYAIVLDPPGGWRNEDERLEGYKDDIKRYTHSFSEDRPVIAMWDESNFMFWSPNKWAMDELFNMFKSGKMLKGAKTGNPFGGTGLFFGGEDFYDKEAEEELISGQRAYTQMWNDVNKEGILDRLKKAGCGYFACSPDQTGPRPEKRRNRKGLPHIRFWLNPMEQRKNNFGWFSVADLDAWIEGTGPIPTKAESEKETEDLINF